MALYIKSYDHHMYSTYFEDSNNLNVLLINCNELIVGKKYKQTEVLFTRFCIINEIDYYIVKI